MMRLLALLLLAFAPAIFVLACGDDNTTVTPRPTCGSGGIYDSSIAEAQKAEFELKYSALINQLQGLSIKPKYNHDMKKIAADVSGPITQNAAVLGINVDEFNGRWYQAHE